MANLTSGIQRYGTNYTPTVVPCTGSPFDVAGTTIYILDTTGGLKSWASGRASFLNNLGGSSKDEIPPYTAFLVLPGGTIVTDDSKLSFGTPIVGATGGIFIDVPIEENLRALGVFES